MDNLELYELFQTIEKQDTCFDRVIMLKQNKKQYKTSDFYKKTHYSIFKAYSLFQLDGLQTLTSLFTKRSIQHLCHGDFAPMQVAIENFIKDLDLSELNDLATIIANKITSVTGNQQQLKEELQDVIKNIKLK